jgi:hypothetical protein
MNKTNRKAKGQQGENRNKGETRSIEERVNKGETRNKEQKGTWGK